MEIFIQNFIRTMLFLSRIRILFKSRVRVSDRPPIRGNFKEERKMIRHNIKAPKRRRLIAQQNNIFLRSFNFSFAKSVLAVIEPYLVRLRLGLVVP
ncbi:hypothetical protein Lal_00022986 [Lupinus albus]|nr:hypothetical protein Lal_00022986 [Lupinus albus]